MNKFNVSTHELNEMIDQKGMSRILKDQYKELIDKHGIALNFTFYQFAVSRLIGNYSFDAVKQKLDYIRTF